MAYQLPVKSTVWVLPPPPPPCPPRLPEALALLSARMLAIKEPSRVVAEASLLGKKYLIIQNGKLGGFSFLQLGTTIVLFGVLRAFQILICFYQKKRSVEGIWTCSLLFGAPLLSYYRLQCCHYALHRRAGPFKPCLPPCTVSPETVSLPRRAVHGPDTESLSQSVGSQMPV